MFLPLFPSFPLKGTDFRKNTACGEWLIRLLGERGGGVDVEGIIKNVQIQFFDTQ